MPARLLPAIWSFVWLTSASCWLLYCLYTAMRLRNSDSRLCILICVAVLGSHLCDGFARRKRTGIHYQAAEPSGFCLDSVPPRVIYPSGITDCPTLPREGGPMNDLTNIKLTLSVHSQIGRKSRPWATKPLQNPVPSTIIRGRYI